jgi:hypothetical protein
VIRIGDQPPELVRMDRLEVDAASLRWTPKSDLTAMQRVKLQMLQRRRERMASRQGMTTSRRSP